MSWCADFLRSYHHSSVIAIHNFLKIHTFLPFYSFWFCIYLLFVHADISSVYWQWKCLHSSCFSFVIYFSLLSPKELTSVSKQWYCEVPAVYISYAQFFCPMIAHFFPLFCSMCDLLLTLVCCLRSAFPLLNLPPVR